MILQVRDNSYIIQARIVDILNPPKDIYNQLFGLLKKYQPDIDMDTVVQIISILGYCKVEQEVKKHLASYSITDLQVQDLYKQMVGEVGIQPSEFFLMSPEEIDWAYNGYLERKETEINLVLTALNKYSNNNFELIKLVEDAGYTIGSIKEREDYFSALGISEVD